MDINAILQSPNAGNIQLVVNAEDLRKCFESWMDFTSQEIEKQRQPHYYTVEEVKDLFKVSTSTIYNWISAGKLHPLRIDEGSRIYFNQEEVRSMLENGTLVRYSHSKV